MSPSTSNVSSARACAWLLGGMPGLEQLLSFMQALAPGLGQLAAPGGQPAAPGGGPDLSRATRIHVSDDGKVTAQGPDGPSVYRAMKDCHKQMLAKHGPNDPRVAGLAKAIENFQGRKE